MSDPYSQQLTDYVEGELTSSSAARLEAHLRTCADCRDELTGLRHLRRAASDLDDRPPQHDLWPAVAQRIESEATGGSAGSIVIAAAAAALLFVALWSNATGPWESPAGSAAAAHDAVAIDDTRPTTLAAAETWRDDVARRALASELAPLFGDDLAIYEHAVTEIRGALAEDPDDPYLRAHLTRTLKHQTRLLRRIDSALSEVL